MSKKILASILSLCMVILICVNCFGAEASIIAIETDKTEISVGERVTVEIYLEEPTDFRGLQFELNYDYGKFTVEKTEKGDVMSDAMISDIGTDSGGKVKAAVVYDDVYTMEGNICSVTLLSRTTAASGGSEFKLTGIKTDIGNDEVTEYEDIRTNIVIPGTEPEKPVLPDAPPKLEIPDKDEPNTPDNPADTPDNPSDNPTDSEDKPGAEGSGTFRPGGIPSETGGPAKEDYTKDPLTQGEPAETICQFTDITNHWAKDDILYLFNRGIVNGMTNTEFAPENQITRAEFVKLLCMSMNLPESKENKFLDNGEEDWYYSYVLKASAAGIVMGEGDYFFPQRNISREEMAVIIYRCIQYLHLEPEENIGVEFDDIDTCSEWSRETVKTLSNYNIINGTEGKFLPKECATRAQAAVIIKRFLLKKES